MGARRATSFSVRAKSHIAKEGAAPCERSCTCPTLILWKGLDRAIHEYLAGVTLQDLIEQSRAQYGNDYMI